MNKVEYFLCSNVLITQTLNATKLLQELGSKYSDVGNVKFIHHKTHLYTGSDGVQSFSGIKAI